MFPIRSTVPLVLAAVLATTGSLSAFADCRAKTAAFDNAARAKSPPEIQRAYDVIKNDTGCDFDIDQYRPRAIGAMIDALSDPAQAGQQKTAEDFAVENLQIAGEWRLAQRLGDYYAASGQQLRALGWYEASIGFIGSHPAQTISATEWRQLEKKASAAKIIASSDDEGRQARPFARSTRDVEGHVGGVLSPPPLRAVEAEAVALPINFIFNDTRFTPAGLDAAEELANALIEQNIHDLRLIGHADPRGDRNYNIALSRGRADAVKAFLIDRLSKKGVVAVIATEGVGAEQPFDVSSLAYTPTQEEVFALDRRVDFVREAH